jgi:hypothetical protein
LSAPALAANPRQVSPDDKEQQVADRIILVLLAVVRAGTLLLGAAETVGSSSFRDRFVVALVMVSLAGQSAVFFLAAARRMPRPGSPTVDHRAVVVEATAGAAALVVVACATPPGLRASSSFWVEPYTVISVVVIAAVTRRAVVGALGAASLAATYLLCLLVLDQRGVHLSRAVTATAWTNALSYLPFFVIAAIGFGLVRSIAGQTQALRHMLGLLSAERARVAAASSAYRIGHDIPKALLREVRRGEMGADKLRPWAAKYREDLRAAVRGDFDPIVDVRDELDALTSAFAMAMALDVDLGALGPDLPPGTPALLVVEAARELLNNASYHRYGYPASLTARGSADSIEVAVHNEGPGLDPGVLRATWARKQNTLHQLEAAGGRYHVASSPGSPAGTTVTLTWPDAEPAAARRCAPWHHLVPVRSGERSGPRARRNGQTGKLPVGRARHEQAGHPQGVPGALRL